MSQKITEIPRAGRLARTMASDIAIYNEEKIRRGIQNDTLFDELKDDLREGVKDWNARVSEEIVNGTNLYEKSLVDLIFYKYGQVGSRIF
jgi:hypothetical protein